MENQLFVVDRWTMDNGIGSNTTTTWEDVESEYMNQFSFVYDEDYIKTIHQSNQGKANKTPCNTKKVTLGLIAIVCVTSISLYFSHLIA